MKAVRGYKVKDLARHTVYSFCELGEGTAYAYTHTRASDDFTYNIIHCCHFSRISISLSTNYGVTVDLIYLHFSYTTPTLLLTLELLLTSPRMRRFSHHAVFMLR